MPSRPCLLSFRADETARSPTWIARSFIRPQVCKPQYRLATASGSKAACRAAGSEKIGAISSRSDLKTAAKETTLAHLLVSKYCDHLPLYRQSEIYAREGIDLDRSILDVAKAKAQQVI